MGEVREVIDPNTAMEAAKEGATALTKLQEIIQKIFGPTWTRKQADADAYADQQKLNTIRDNPDMEIIYVDGKIHARQCTVEELSQRSQQRMLAEAVRQERNIENVIGIAADELSHQNDKASDTLIDEDWITRLFSIVKDVNSEEMQYVWGKILAGEIVSPGSFSLRTLDTIRNIGRTEAHAFQKILPIVVKGGGTFYITSDHELLKKYGIPYSEILLLEECGLVNCDFGLSMNPTIGQGDEFVCYNNKLAVLIQGSAKEKVKISFDIITLTHVGTELFNILLHTINTDSILDLAEIIRKINKKANVTIAVYEITKIIENKIYYGSNPIKVFEKEC